MAAACSPGCFLVTATPANISFPRMPGQPHPDGVTPPHRVTSVCPQLCGDNANCIFDAVLAGEEVGQATLEAEEADRAFQEEVGGES